MGRLPRNGPRFEGDSQVCDEPEPDYVMRLLARDPAALTTRPRNVWRAPQKGRAYCCGPAAPEVTHASIFKGAAVLFAPCPRNPYTAQDRFFVPVGPVASLWEIRCHCTRGIWL